MDFLKYLNPLYWLQKLAGASMTALIIVLAVVLGIGMCSGSTFTKWASNALDSAKKAATSVKGVEEDVGKKLTPGATAVGGGQPTPGSTETWEVVGTETSSSSGSHSYMFPVSPADSAEFAEDQGLKSPAVLIYAPEGTNVVAATSGTIELVSTEDKYDPAVAADDTKGGIYVSIIGDDGFRYYYSQMASVVEGLEPGKQVFAGAILGTVGQSGNGNKIPPHVYFAISSSTPDDWATRRGTIQPHKYLKAWLAGENITPE